MGKKATKKSDAKVKKKEKQPKIRVCQICGGVGQIRVVFRDEDGKAKGKYIYCRENPDESFKPTVEMKKYILKES